MKRKPGSPIGTFSDVLSIGQWTWDRFAAFLTSAAGAALIAVAARASTWLNSYGAIAWTMLALVVFLAIFLCVALGTRLLAAARSERTQARFAEQMLDVATINPLERRFVDKRIRMADFTTPLGDPVPRKVFENCDLIGPATVVLAPLTGTIRLSENEFRAVEFVRLTTDVMIAANKIILDAPTITNCRLYNLIIMIPEQFADQVNAGIGGAGAAWLNPPRSAVPEGGAR